MFRWLRREKIRLVFVNADAECDEALRMVDKAYAEALVRLAEAEAIIQDLAAMQQVFELSTVDYTKKMYQRWGCTLCASVGGPESETREEIHHTSECVVLRARVWVDRKIESQLLTRSPRFLQLAPDADTTTTERSVQANRAPQ